MKILEQRLGVRLYEKIRRRVRLTQAAEIILPYIQDALAQLDAAGAALNEWKGLRRGVVRIGAGPAMSCYVLPHLLRRYQRAFPGIELTVATGTTVVLLDSLSRGTLDLALLISSDLLEQPDFRVETHWDFEMVLVGRRKQAPHRCRLAELRKFPFILFQKGSRMEDTIDRYFAANHFEPRVIMRFDNAEAISAMIHSGLGVSMLPTWIVDRDLKARRLSVIRQSEPPLISRIALVTRKSGFVPEPVRMFIAGARKMAWKWPELTSGARSRA